MSNRTRELYPGGEMTPVVMTAEDVYLAAYENQRTAVTAHGKAIAAIVPAEDLARLETWDAAGSWPADGNIVTEHEIPWTGTAARIEPSGYSALREAIKVARQRGDIPWLINPAGEKTAAIVPPERARGYDYPGREHRIKLAEPTPDLPASGNTTAGRNPGADVTSRLEALGVPAGAQVTIGQLTVLAGEITTGLADGYQEPETWTLTSLVARAAGLQGNDMARHAIFGLIRELAGPPAVLGTAGLLVPVPGQGVPDGRNAAPGGNTEPDAITRLAAVFGQLYRDGGNSLSRVIPAKPEGITIEQHIENWLRYGQQ